MTRSALHAAYTEATAILEYGAGDMTRFAAQETTATVLTVDSDREKLETLRADVPEDRFVLHHANIGDIREDGYPKRSRRWQEYPGYAFTPWDAGFEPDLVVIGGRFRLACFAAALLYCRGPLRLIFRAYEGDARFAPAGNLVPPDRIEAGDGYFTLDRRAYARGEVVHMIEWFFRVD